LASYTGGFLPMHFEREYTMSTHDEAYWRLVFCVAGAISRYDGNPEHSHPWYTRGGHGRYIFNADRIIERSSLLDCACADLVEALRRTGLDLNSVDWVIGPEKGAVKIADGIARHIAKIRGRECLAASATRKDDGLIVFERVVIEPEQRILFVEDVINTGATLDGVARAVESLGAVALPYLTALVNRSGSAATDSGRQIVSLFAPRWKTWKAEECPFCPQGSKALRPKGNWGSFKSTVLWR